ncbi:MAG: aminofutalosine synthase MqnE [Verrucomicrobia bacterium]|nr:aminofutalosine synthase MqnE [Verrucomicrobiota bacterium]
MNFWLRKSRLAPILDRALEGKRLSEEEGLELLRTRDVHALAAAADARCRQHNGDRASFILNRYINYTNYCILSCQFCAFARKKRRGDGFELTIEQILAKAKEALQWGATELHIVGGLHPSLPFEYYLEMLRELKRLAPRLQLKCFTAIEILHTSRLGKRPPKETLRLFREAGLDALTGGGAEIFAPEPRRRIARGKETAEEWLDIHRQWHRLGGRSTCTMLYGHLESLRDRVDHLRRLRELQDETGGFVGFVPLPYQPENNRLPVRHSPTGLDTLRTIAAARLFLDNFKHITAYWVGLGVKLAQTALCYGADDLHGTIHEEHIFHMAGSETPQIRTREEMIRAIRDAGRVPILRDTFYQPLGEAVLEEETSAAGGARNVAG